MPCIRREVELLSSVNSFLLEVQRKEGRSMIGQTFTPGKTFLDVTELQLMGIIPIS